MGQAYSLTVFEMQLQAGNYVVIGGGSPCLPGLREKPGDRSPRNSRIASNQIQSHRRLDYFVSYYSSSSQNYLEKFT